MRALPTAIAGVVLAALVLGSVRDASADARLLVFSKTTGFRHDSIPTAIAALEVLAPEHAWTITATEDAAVFTDGTLDTIDVAVFMMNTGDILDTAQQDGLQAFVEAGHGFVALHSVTNAEEEWPWFETLLGTRFADHPAQQDAIVHVADPTHPACVGLPEPWPRFDEWYNFTSNPSRDVDVLLWLDETSYTGGTMGRQHPIAWTHVVSGARVFYTAGGHTHEAWADAAWLGHVAGGIEWVIEGEPAGGTTSTTSGDGGSDSGSANEGSSGGDRGSTGGTAGDSGGATVTSTTTTAPTDDSSGAVPQDGGDTSDAGCGCAHTAAAPIFAVLVPLVRRRRREQSIARVHPCEHAGADAERS